MIAIGSLSLAYLFLQHGFLDVDSDSKDCVRPGTARVHQSLRCATLLASPLEDAVHLGLGMDLDLLQTLFRKFIKPVSMMGEIYLGYT